MSGADRAWLRSPRFGPSSAIGARIPSAVTRPLQTARAPTHDRRAPARSERDTAHIAQRLPSPATARLPASSPRLAPATVTPRSQSSSVAESGCVHTRGNGATQARHPAVEHRKAERCDGPGSSLALAVTSDGLIGPPRLQRRALATDDRRARLTDEQIAAIRRIIAEEAGAEARTRVFGSRLRDERKGGDLDLYVTLDQAVDNPALLSARIAARVGRTMDGRHVDVLLSAPNLRRLPIHTVAEREGLPI